MLILLSTVNWPCKKPISLQIFDGVKYFDDVGCTVCMIFIASPDALEISSEPLLLFRSDWVEVLRWKLMLVCTHHEHACHSADVQYSTVLTRK